MSHRLQASQLVPLARSRVFEFFADPVNLAKITPPELSFRMLTPPPVTMRSGAELEYRIRALGLPLRWRSLIREWDPPGRFVDVQLSGPYKHWCHTHAFVEQAGGTLVVDEVEYALPLWPVGELAHPLVRRQLERIFAFRRQAIERLLT